MDVLAKNKLEFMLFVSIKRAGFEKVQKIAEALGRKLTRDELEKMLEKYIKGGCFHDAQKTVKKLRIRGKLTQDELKEIFSTTENLNTEREVAKEFSEPKRTEELEEVFKRSKRCANNYSSICEAYKVAEVLGREVTQDELREMISNFYSKFEADKVIEIIKKLNEPNRTRRLNELITQCVRMDYFSDAQEAIRELNELDRTIRSKEIIARYIEDRKLDYALEIAKELNEPDRTSELEYILTKYIENRKIDKAQETVEAIGRKLTKDELIGMITNHSVSNFRKAQKIAIGLDESDKTQVLEYILSEYIKTGSFSDAKETVNKLGRELTQDEILNILGSKYFGLLLYDSKRSIEIIECLDDPNKTLFMKALV